MFRPKLDPKLYDNRINLKKFLLKYRGYSLSVGKRAQVKLLKSCGIDEFVFHVADFYRNRQPAMRRKSRTLSLAIHKHADKLILYGFGSQRRLQEYSFAEDSG